MKLVLMDTIEDNKYVVICSCQQPLYYIGNNHVNMISNNYIFFLLVIRREAQLDVEGQFLVRIIYEDAKTYDLVAAASKVLSTFFFNNVLRYKIHYLNQFIHNIIVRQHISNMVPFIKGNLL